MPLINKGIFHECFISNQNLLNDFQAWTQPKFSWSFTMLALLTRRFAQTTISPRLPLIGAQTRKFTRESSKLFNSSNLHIRLPAQSFLPSLSTPNTSQLVNRTQSPLLHQQVRTFKVRSAIKKKCEHCYIRRKKNKKWYVYCKVNPRHKQRQL